MERKALEEKLVSIQQQFDAVTKTKVDAEAEIYRLQGDYRTVQEMIDNLEDAPDTFEGMDTFPTNYKKEKKNATK